MQREQADKGFDWVFWLAVFFVGYITADIAARLHTIAIGGSWFAFPIF